MPLNAELPPLEKQYNATPIKSRRKLDYVKGVSVDNCHDNSARINIDEIE